jgi:hypothetical protein
MLSALVALSTTFILVFIGTISSLNLLGGGHAALRFQRVFVLVFAAQLVALGDDIGGVDHRHEDIGRRLQEIRIDRFLGRAAAGNRDALDAAGDDAVGAVRADRIGGHRDGLQTRGAEAVDRHAGGRLRHAGEQRCLAADIGSAMRAIAEIAILDIFLVDASALDGVLDGMGRHRHRRSDIEPAAAGFCQPGAGIRNDDGFTHFFGSPFGLADDAFRKLSSYIIIAGAMKIPPVRAFRLPELPQANPAGCAHLSRSSRSRCRSSVKRQAAR